jgi:predicted deacylase
LTCPGIPGSTRAPIHPSGQQRTLGEDSRDTGRADACVELAAPDIGRWRAGTTGVDYVHSFAAARPGRHVLITGLVHGNEICGAIALDRLLGDRLRPVRGRLSLAFVNVAAYERFDPARPAASRYLDEDFNRLWSAEVLAGPGSSRELRRARALRPLVDSADLLLDLHSLQQGDEALALCGPLAKGRELARRLGWPATVIADRGHAAGVRLRDYAGFADPASDKTALLVECGQHWRAGTGRAAIEAAIRFLVAVGAVEATVARAYGADRPAPRQRWIEVCEAVTVATAQFAFARPFRGLEVIPKAGTLIARDGRRRIVTPFDACVLVMPSLGLKPGQTAVRLGRLVP